MGCGSSSAGQRTTSPEEIENDDEAIMRELYGEKMIYDKRSDTYIPESAYKPDEGEKAGACKPFTGTLTEPARHPPVNPEAPDENYELEYVYGYRTYDCRENLYFTANQKIVYCVASLGIILDTQTNTQTFFGRGISTKAPGKRYHENDVICLAISPDRKLAATGDVGVRPVVNIWSTETGELKTSFMVSQKGTRGIACCGWSSDCKYVAAADKAEKVNIYVIDAATGKAIQTGDNTRMPAFTIVWSKKSGDNTFAICGPKNISFWTVGGKSRKGTGCQGQSFTSATYDTNGVCYAGAFNGNIYVFSGSSTSKNVPAHKGSVLSMCWSDSKLFTGGLDNYIMVFDDSLKQINKISVGSGPRALDVNDDTILTGLRNGSICLVSQSHKQISGYLMKSHHDGEVWGLDVTENGEVITSGDDNKIMLWSPKERKNKDVDVINEKKGPKIKYGASSMTNLPDNQCARAISINPQTNEFALALNDGQVQIRDLSNISSVKNTMQACDRWIECMDYSPNGQYLAVGTHTSVVVVYSTDTYAQKGVLKGNSAAILSIDWSKDSSYLRTVSLSYELLYYNVDSCKQDTSGATNTKNVEWATQTCKFGWSVQGIFEDEIDYSQVNGVTISTDEKLIASGNDHSAVSYFRNPCLKGSKAKKLYGHSEHVVRVKFGLDDQYIFSVGGQDKTLMQWRKC